MCEWLTKNPSTGPYVHIMRCGSTTLKSAVTSGRQLIIVLAQPAVLIDPRERSLYYPSPWQDCKAWPRRRRPLVLRTHTHRLGGRTTSTLRPNTFSAQSLPLPLAL